MSKKRKTFTLDPEVKAYLSAEGRNASQTVNKLVKMEMGEGIINEQLIKMRMENEKDRYEDAAQKARGHLERYNQLKSRLSDERNQKRQKLAEAREVFADANVDEDNPAVQNWANDLDMTPAEFVEEIQ